MAAVGSGLPVEGFFVPTGALFAEETSWSCMVGVHSLFFYVVVIVGEESVVAAAVVTVVVFKL